METTENSLLTIAANIPRNFPIYRNIFNEKKKQKLM